VNDEERREAWALFRYNVIAPLLESGLDSAERALRERGFGRTFWRKFILRRKERDGQSPSEHLDIGWRGTKRVN
jgi:hypothetical protein